MAPATMRAAVIYEAGGPSQFKIEDVPLPQPGTGEVLIRIRAFGLNRSEYFTRLGHSPSVKFPRILGIECVGTLVSTPSSTSPLKEGDIVATCMGGLGRDINGSYAEYTVVPERNVKTIKLASTTSLSEAAVDWATLAALPEMSQTAYGSLEKGLRFAEAQTLLVRGGTTSVGLMAAALAKSRGLRVLATTRNPASEDLLRRHGVDHIVIDAGSVAGAVREIVPDGVDGVLELVGVTTLRDSLQCCKVGGIVCNTGIVGNKWELTVNPMELIPKGVYLTAYGGDVEDFLQMPLQEIVDLALSKKIQVPIGKVFTGGLDDIIAAHELMDHNKAGGKIVVVL